jgi:uncharacterized membrane protein YidH (DUF202 family)
MSTFLIFAGLQLADLATTLVFLDRGVAEANPLVRALIGAVGQPLLAVLLVKMAGCAMALCAWHSRRTRLLKNANIFFALCIGWNLLAIAAV